jgi:protein TonB
MHQHPTAAAEIFSIAEIARAAGVSPAAARALVERRRLPSRDGFLAAPHAVRCVRLLRLAMAEVPRKDLFAPPPAPRRSPLTGAASSAVVHAGAVGLAIVLASLGLSKSEPLTAQTPSTRMVFLATPGPGGGGGGGGLRQPAPPPKAEMKSAAAFRSPVPPPRPLTSRKPEPVVERPKPPAVTPQPVRAEEPPAPPPAVIPQVVAPVASASSDARDRAGLLNNSPSEADSQGRGAGGGVGTGEGSGIGEGTGAGIGPGSGGGTGGGPYRPGSGITAPDLLREVRPDYTDDARRLGIEGDVVLEIIVRADGSVGDIRVVEGLRGGLDRRAVEAVKQWRFSPARRYGVPVDVVVEVAVEFKLR